jgi:hypothetical protein
MLCIGVTLGGYWRSLSPEAFLDWFATNSRFISNAIPLLVLPTLVGLAGSLGMAWNSASFAAWVASALSIMAVLILTFAFFLPANTAFANKTIELVALTAKLDQWLMLHYVRVALAMLAAVLGCVAIKI